MMKLKFIFLFLFLNIAAQAQAEHITVQFYNDTHEDIPLLFVGEKGSDFCGKNTSFIIPANQLSVLDICFTYRNKNISDNYAYIFSFRYENDRKQIIRFVGTSYYWFNRDHNSWSTYKVRADGQGINDCCFGNSSGDVVWLYGWDMNSWVYNDIHILIPISWRPISK